MYTMESRRNDYVQSSLPGATVGNVLLVAFLLACAIGVGLLVSGPDHARTTPAPALVLTGFGHPGAVSAGPRGIIYVADQERGVITCIFPNGERTDINQVLDRPTALAVDSAGTIYVYSLGDRAIHMLSPNGTELVVASDLPPVMDMDATPFGMLVVSCEDGSVRQLSLATL